MVWGREGGGSRGYVLFHLCGGFGRLMGRVERLEAETKEEHRHECLPQLSNRVEGRGEMKIFCSRKREHTAGVACRVDVPEPASGRWPRSEPPA